MSEPPPADSKKKLVSTERALSKIEPGMSIFLGTGAMEPRTLVKHLMASDENNLQDLELIQLVSFGDAISLEALNTHKFRLKTFFSGWVAFEAITTGRVDLIPSRFSRIPHLIETDEIRVDAAFVKVTPPDEAGYCSLGVAVDVARSAMERASLSVGEICSKTPRTIGDTFIHVNDFDYLVQSVDDPICFPRWPLDEVMDKVAANVASLIEDGNCIGFSLGPLFEGLGKHLVGKRSLGIHSPFFTDPLMDLVRSGAVTNRYKSNFRGKCLASYALGTPELYAWLDGNALVEFQAVDKVFDPAIIGENDRFILILPARKVDLTGRLALHIGKGNVIAGPGEAMDFVNGAELSRGGRTIFALPSRNLKGESNIRVSVEDFPNEFPHRELVDLIATEYGVASLTGCTVRERAQALIDIAHPDHREGLVEQAKLANLLYADQIYLADSARLYPEDVASTNTFKDDLVVRFRAIKPSDEEQMRRLFYRFSDKAVYYRYFSPIKTMPHTKMQAYVNINYRRAMSLVGKVGETGQGRIIAEGRYVLSPNRPYADVAFVVDEEYQGKGIGTFLFHRLIQIARQRGILGFTADVLATNKSMMKVFERSPFPIRATLDTGVYSLSLPFKQQETDNIARIQYDYKGKK